MHPISKDVLDLFRYRDGHLYYKEPKGARHSGPVGYVTHHGYVRVKAFGKCYQAHRIIYALHHGDTTLDVDHINRVKTDNRIENLRAISHSANTANQNSGVLFASHNKWRARYGQEHLGYFDNALDAWAKRKSAENHYAQH